MSVLQQIGEWATHLTPNDIPEDVRHAARRLIMDQVGVSHAGTARNGVHPTALLAAHLSGSPSATIWTRGETFAPYATLANRAAGDHLELTAGPECVAAGIATAEAVDASFGKLLCAVTVGAEVEDYIKRWLMLSAERHGLHPPALLGTLAASATSAYLHDLSADGFASVLAAACCLMPQSPYSAFSGGASSKTLYGAWAQMLGVWSSLWLEAGVLGPLSVLEGSRGVAQALLDTQAAVKPPPFEPQGWAINRVTFKAFPCSRACHPALTALDELMAIDPANVRRVEVWSYPFSVELDRRSRSETLAAAQMSIRKTLAQVLTFGELIPGEDYQPNDLEKRITVEVDPNYREDEPRVRRARLRIALEDGRTLEAEAEPRWGPSQPATDEELRQRFCQLTEKTGAFDPWFVRETTSVRDLVRGKSGG